MPEKTRLQRAILRAAYLRPESTRDDIAADLDCSARYVGKVLREGNPQSGFAVPDATDWDDPERCPFCGTELEDGGAGFVDHIARTPECDAAFAQWRERVASDIGGEWSG